MIFNPTPRNNWNSAFMTPENIKIIKVLAMAGLAAATAACGGGGIKKNNDVTLASYSAEGAKAATVNRYLWAASLETLDFLPVASADPIAGLILTDWYINPAAPNERLKTTVYILDSALRADALRVSVFRQQKDADGQWVDAAVNPATSHEIENAILTRARQLRLNNIDN